MLSETVTGDTILPGFGLDDLRPELIARAQGPGAALSDEEFLLGAGLARRDADGDTGITLPALLLFGADEALRAALPGHGTVAVLRDARGRVTREEIRTNLLDTFDRLMAFAARHLPEAESAPGAPENLRDLVLGELFLNSLLHRDYAKPFPARFGIEPGRVFLENGSAGRSRAPKNPALARLFARMGWKRAGGAALRFARAYFGAEPLVFEGALYRFVACYPKHGAAEMQAVLRELPKRAAPPARVAAPAAAEPAAAKPRPTIRELEALLSEKLPEFTGALLASDLELSFDEALRAENHEAPVRPAFAMPRAPENASEYVARIPVEAPAAVPPVARVASPKPPAAAKPAPGPFPSPVPTSATPPTKASSPAPAPDTESRTARILKFCETPRHRAEIQAFAGFQNRDYFRKEILNPLIEQGLLAPTLPDKPNSPNQQYRATRV